MRLSVVIVFIILAGSLTILMKGCLATPDGVEPVDDFDPGRYLGKWYEIARLDHSFERGLNNVTAEYSLRDDGGIQVVNRGFSTIEDEWEEAVGRAYLVGDENTGHLKVSFFGPLFSSYVIWELDDEEYSYAFISGPTTSYLWLLARAPNVSRELVDRFIEMADERGFNTEDLIFVDHDQMLH